MNELTQILRPAENTRNMIARRGLFAALAMALVGACGEAPGSSPPHETTSHDSTPDASEQEPYDPTRCAAPPGVSASPTSIAETVTLINTLPRPVTVACVVEALASPLHMNASDSRVSAQPAAGVESPRVFIMNEGLILSITLGDTGRHLLEFGEFRDDGLTIKGELIFPIEGEVTPSQPYAHLPYTEEITTCGLCHRDEVSAGFIDGVERFASRPLRPIEISIVPLEDLEALHDTCDPLEDQERCDLLSALFGHEVVMEEHFSTELHTIFR